MSIPLWTECAWSCLTLGETNPDVDLWESSEEGAGVRFSVDDSINKKIFLYLGSGYKIPCNACIVGQNEQLNDHTEDNSALLALAGPAVEEELISFAPIQTGESIVTSGGFLPCDWLIHAVGPRYDSKYLTASDHALFSAYKNSLRLAAEKKSSDVVISCIYFKKKKYPRLEAAHVALRTVRKFLQQSIGESFERVMFCVPTPEDYEIYASFMHAYFPRSQKESISHNHILPPDLGDEWGEIVLEDRVLKVSAGPQPLPRSSLTEYRSRTSDEPTNQQTDGQNKFQSKTGDRQLVGVGDLPASMSTLDRNKDLERQSKIAQEFAKMSRQERMALKFKVMMEDLEYEKLDEIEDLDIIRIAGMDRKGRSVVLIVACNLRKAIKLKYEEELILLSFMKVMENMRCRPFVLIYCSGLGILNSDDVDEAVNHIETNVTQSIFDLFSVRYKENLMQLYVLHASFTLRMYIWLALPFLSSPFWGDYKCVANLESLNKFMEVQSLSLPDVVLEQDKAFR